MGTILVLILLVLAGAVAAYVLLARITERGGERYDGLKRAAQFITQANAFRGSRDDADVPWDGEPTIAPPTQDGGAGGI